MNHRFKEEDEPSVRLYFGNWILRYETGQNQEEKETKKGPVFHFLRPEVVITKCGAKQYGAAAV